MNSFKTQLLLVFSVLIAAALGATIYSVFTATEQSIVRETREELQTAQRVFSAILEDRSLQLLDRTSILAADFGLKRAIATNELDTAMSALGNHGDRAGAALVALLNPEGEVLAASHTLQGSLAGNIATGNGDAFVRFIVAEGELFQLAFVPVRAPGLLAWVGLGFKLDVALMDSFKSITRADITFLFRRTSVTAGGGLLDSPLSMISTLPDMLLQEGLDDSMTLGLAREALQARLQDKTWFSQSLTFQASNADVTGLVSKSLDARLADFSQLRQQIGTIAVVALILSLLLALFFARSLSKPIESLVARARRIASGDYTKDLKLQAAAEFMQLESALQTMGEAIGERERRIQFQAEHDLLTSLPNRDYISKVIENRKFEAGGVPRFGLALIRLTNLTPLTDVYGQRFADDLLQQFADRARRLLRRGDMIARIDADRFLGYCDQLDHSGVPALTEKILSIVARPFEAEGIEVRVELHVGIVLSPDHGASYDDLLRRAHIALKSAEQARATASVYQIGMDELHLRQIRITSRLQLALHKGGFELNYQPKVDSSAGDCKQVEALLRWRDAEMGQMFPDEFIPLAEHSGDILLITDWVIQEVIRQQLIWLGKGRYITVSINLSAHDLLSKTLVDRLLGQLAHAGLESHCLHFEITESATISDPVAAIAQLERLRDAGFRLSMDDFGTGYSSLSQLKLIPVQEVKIDKSFILKLDEQETDQRLVRSIIDMGHNLGLSIVAEGVENEASSRLLTAWGCEYLQGYWYSKPLPPEALEIWLDDFENKRSGVLS
ncbi:putative bifunctional diguanylate cyclase/phosphodiesterase [Allohahella marinimesophila]|uniref:Bifunctional diguanylate cyclase/phosphodiesterase n=1 Tax=Allohahella marinimesophila TaxID=1054972 RepID=A0ABP7PWW7_9GAMM